MSMCDCNFGQKFEYCHLEDKSGASQKWDGGHKWVGVFSFFQTVQTRNWQIFIDTKCTVLDINNAAAIFCALTVLQIVKQSISCSLLFK